MCSFTHRIKYLAMLTIFVSNYIYIIIIITSLYKYVHVLQVYMEWLNIVCGHEYDVDTISLYNNWTVTSAPNFSFSKPQFLMGTVIEPTAILYKTTVLSDGVDIQGHSILHRSSVKKCPYDWKLLIYLSTHKILYTQHVGTVVWEVLDHSVYR